MEGDNIKPKTAVKLFLMNEDLIGTPASLDRCL